jgi:hypothetical protein
MLSRRGSKLITRKPGEGEPNQRIMPARKPAFRGAAAATMSTTPPPYSDDVPMTLTASTSPCPSLSLSTRRAADYRRLVDALSNACTCIMSSEVTVYARRMHTGAPMGLRPAVRCYRDLLDACSDAETHGDDEVTLMVMQLLVDDEATRPPFLPSRFMAEVSVAVLWLPAAFSLGSTHTSTFRASDGVWFVGLAQDHTETLLHARMSAWDYHQPPVQTHTPTHTHTHTPTTMSSSDPAYNSWLLDPAFHEHFSRTAAWRGSPEELAYLVHGIQRARLML